MTQDATELVVAAGGGVYVADAGTAEPVLDDVLTGTWAELGFITTDGVRPSATKDTEDIEAWQSFYPLRKLVTGIDLDIAFDLMQWNADTVPFAFGGGVIDEVETGIFRFTPADPGVLDERALVVRWQDGDTNGQLYVPRGVITGNSEFTLSKDANANLPVTYSATPASNSEKWLLQSDSEAWEPAS